MSPEGVDVYVNSAAFNPLLSMKDHLSIGLLDWAQCHGKLTPGQTVVASVTGNTGIGLALACKEMGYPLVYVVTEGAVAPWRQMMRFLGAKVLVSEEPPVVGRRLADSHGWFHTGEFQRQANKWIHEHNTGPAILEALQGRRLDFFVAPHGTGGMLQGIGSVLRSRSPDTRICVVEQDSCPHPDYEAMNGPHPSWPQDMLRGWTTDFAPRAMDKEVRDSFVDEVVHIRGGEAMQAAQELAREEGLLTGISGGALAAGALRVARAAPPGSSVLTVLLDTGEFHFNTPLVHGAPAEMSREELELLREAEPDPLRSRDVVSRVDGHY